MVEQLKLQPHPEGGWYREIHRSPLEVEREDGQKRSASTLIWFLLQAEDLSRWHRVIGAEESWHHAAGDPLELWLLPPAGGVAQRRVIGSMHTGHPLHLVPAGWWQAARCLGTWSLVNCGVAPGFDFQDFELLHHKPCSDHPPGALRELL